MGKYAIFKSKYIIGSYISFGPKIQEGNLYFFYAATIKIPVVDLP
jgi:hypothetical protein